MTIISIIPKRTTCDTCEQGYLNREGKYYCLKHYKWVSSKGYCTDYLRLGNSTKSDKGGMK